MNPNTTILNVVRILLMLALLPGLTALARAEGGAVARATFVSGDVKARSSAGTMRPLTRGGELNAGDTVVTGAGASAQLTFADNSRLAVRAATEFAIDEFRMGGDEGFVLRLTRGALRSITGLIGQRNKKNFSLRTPVATIGIRGTDFEAVHVPQGGTGAIGGGVDPGTYNKVYAGGTEMMSKAGKIDLGINEVGFIGLAGGAGGGGPVKIDQLPAGIIKVIDAAPIVGKAEPAAPDAAPGGEPAAGAPATGGTDASTTTLKLDSKTLTTTKLPTATIDSTSLKTLDTKATTLDSSTLKTLDTAISPTTTTLDKATLGTTLDSSAIKTTTLPTTTTTVPVTTLPTTTIDATKLNTTTINATTLPSTTTSTIKLNTNTQLTK
jgi:hypothetical protein